MTKWIAAMIAAYSVACASQVSAQTTKLMLFGGEDHKTYLGCLNCSAYATDSVHNEYGDQGSQYATDSIFNHYGQFGSPYSNDSPCNRYANDPPVIVDDNGAFYGRLTLNAYHPQANKNEKLQGWLAGLCER